MAEQPRLALGPSIRRMEALIPIPKCTLYAYINTARSMISHTGIRGQLMHVEDLTRQNDNLHKHDILDDERYNSFRPHVEAAFDARCADPSRDGVCAHLADLARDATCAAANCSNCKGTVSTYGEDVELGVLLA